MAAAAASLLALARMLGGGAPEEEEEEEEEEEALASPPPPSGSRAGPGSLGPAKAPADPSGGGGRGGRGGRGARTLVEAGEHQGIWTPEEVPEGPEYEDTWEAREQPEYEILFKQQVGAEDVFLGMSRKDPSTACCEDLLIKIKLPDTKASDITLDIREKVLDLRSPQKKLLLHLPHPVDTQSGKACFLSEQGLLEVTLRMRRELDFLNFA